MKSLGDFNEYTYLLPLDARIRRIANRDAPAGSKGKPLTWINSHGNPLHLQKRMIEMITVTLNKADADIYDYGNDIQRHQLLARLTNTFGGPTKGAPTETEVRHPAGHLIKRYKKVAR